MWIKNDDSDQSIILCREKQSESMHSYIQYYTDNPQKGIFEMFIKGFFKLNVKLANPTVNALCQRHYGSVNWF